LLYVASTRARRRLHLIGHVDVQPDDGSLEEPPRDSLLAHLWPKLRPMFEQRLGENAVASGPAPRPARVLRRLKLEAMPVNLEVDDFPSQPDTQGLSEEREDDLQRRIGTITHLLLDRIARDGVDAWPEERIRELRPVLEDEDTVAASVVEALVRTVSDPVGRWILAQRPEAESEFGVSALLGAKVRHFVLDRTFVSEDGVRWIIDFKTSEAEDIAAHREQLERYAAVMKRLERWPVRLGLYFPMTGRWIDWEPRLSNK
jgi:ATP-dependent exoDNAse (exonuclease V) beta subunit